MKSVKSVSDLKAMALARGAAVEMGASRFNTSRDKIARLERQTPSAPTPEPRPEPAPAPSPAAQVDVKVDMEPVAEAMQRMQQLQAGLVQSLSQQIAQLAPGQPVQEWEFTVNRNPDGTLASIRAKAIR